MYKLQHSPYWYANNTKLRDYIAEKHPDARFVEEIALKTRNGGYSDNPGLVFYQENPPAPFTNKFFAYYCYIDVEAIASETPRKDRWTLVGLESWDPVVNAVVNPKTETLAISRYRHDYFTTTCGMMIDGGRDYSRCGGTIVPEMVPLNLFTNTFDLDGETYEFTR